METASSERTTGKPYTAGRILSTLVRYLATSEEKLKYGFSNEFDLEIGGFELRSLASKAKDFARQRLSFLSTGILSSCNSRVLLSRPYSMVWWWERDKHKCLVWRFGDPNSDLIPAITCHKRHQRPTFQKLQSRQHIIINT